MTLQDRLIEWRRLTRDKANLERLTKQLKAEIEADPNFQANPGYWADECDVQAVRVHDKPTEPMPFKAIADSIPADDRKAMDDLLRRVEINAYTSMPTGDWLRIKQLLEVGVLRVTVDAEALDASGLRMWGYLLRLATVYGYVMPNAADMERLSGGQRQPVGWTISMKRGKSSE
jgi:hypothetical protein